MRFKREQYDGSSSAGSTPRTMARVIDPARDGTTADNGIDLDHMTIDNADTITT